MPESVYAVVEVDAQSLDTERDDLGNEMVLTFPVIGGPFKDRHEAERLADDATESYAVVETPADWWD